MDERKRYYMLDDIGYLGSSTSGESEIELREQRKVTAEYFKALRAGKSKKAARRLAVKKVLK